MRKDYAKHSSEYVVNKRKKKQRTLPFRIRWVLLGFVAIVFVASVFYAVPQIKKLLPKHLAPIQAKLPTPQTTQPQFDFYTILPKAEAPATLKNAKQYVLQVGSAKTLSEADRLKEQMILLGFNARITKQQKDDETSEQVSLGPYSSLKAAKADQQRLAHYHIKTTISSH